MELESVNTNQLIVTQANSLVYAAYEMTLQEKRLLLLLFSMVRQDHTKFHTYRIPVKQIGELLEIDRTNIYRVLDKTCTKLMSRVLHVEAPKTKSKKERWVKFHWVARAEYIPKEDSKTGEAELELKIHDELHPLLLELKKQFASVPLEHVANLPSYHSIRIFEILYHKSQRLQKSKIRIPLDDLKKSLGVENSYPNFSNFKTKILEPAKKNLVKKTPLKFTYLTVKKGNKVIALDFVVKENLPKGNQPQLPLDMPRTLRFLQLDTSERETPSQHEKLLKELATMDYAGNGLELIKQIGEQEVRYVLKLAKEQEQAGEKSGKEIKNMGGLISYLVEKEAWKEFAAEERSKQVAQLLESIGKEYIKACQAYKQEQWQQLDNWQQEQIKEDIKQNGRKFSIQFLDVHGWDETTMFFIQERDASMKRLGISFDLPPHLDNKESYIRSQQKYQDVEPEVIERVIAALGM